MRKGNLESATIGLCPDAAKHLAEGGVEKLTGHRVVSRLAEDDPLRAALAPGPRFEAEALPALTVRPKTALDRLVTGATERERGA